MSVTVRPAAPGDAPALHALNVAFNDVRATPSYIAAALAAEAQTERLFVAELDGEVVGMVGLRLLPCVLDPEPYAELTELYVAERARRRGVGRALVGAVEQAARAGGASRLVLLTAWRNGTAHQFYHALGYQLYTVTMLRELGAPPQP
jgi:GNAT superfamily N-acetyltransferase